MEAPQHAHRFQHRLRRKEAAPEVALSQEGDLAVFVDFFQSPGLQARNFQTNGIRSDVDGGKGGHRGRSTVDELMLTISILTTGAGRASSAASRELRARRVLALSFY